MKRSFRLTGVLFGIAAVLMLAGCSEETGMIKAEDVRIDAVVRPTGQYPESFTVTYSADVSKKDVKAVDFHMKGKAGSWGSNAAHDFEADFESLTVKGDTITLIPKDFPEKFFYVKSYEVKCNDPDLSFSNEDVSAVSTLVADDFADLKAEGEKASFDYHLFTPDKTENMPIVVVFHGYGDTNNLLTYRTAVAWAEPKNQEIRPCYIMAPVIPDDKYFNAGARANIIEEVMVLVRNMADEGKVDRERVYVMGNSFGGMTSIELAEAYPDEVAGVMALCPALMYSDSATANISKMKDVPLFILHAEHDGTIPFTDSQKAVDILNKAGAKDVRLKGFTDEEMNAAGGSSDKDSTYSYHHVELAVMEDDSYMEWLYGL